MEKKNTHGGDILSAREVFTGEILDFSVNINPLGMPESIAAAASDSISRATQYPDPLCRELRAAIAERDGVHVDWVLCGNGAADIIFRLAFAERPRRALITAPTFSEYEEALRCVGCEIAYHHLKPEDDFDLTDSILDSLRSGDDTEPDIVFLCNPNNPTGRGIKPELLSQIMDTCRERGMRLVIDECFLELSNKGDGTGLSGYLGIHSELILLRAFTKSFAIPGLRLGYCLCSDKELINALIRCGQAWAVSIPAQEAGMAALRFESDFPARARELLAVERPRLAAALRELGLTVYDSTVNYMMFRAEGVTDLKERMLARGILIRSCANYIGLGEDYYRVAVRTADENDALCSALSDVLR